MDIVYLLAYRKYQTKQSWRTTYSNHDMRVHLATFKSTHLQMLFFTCTRSTGIEHSLYTNTLYHTNGKEHIPLIINILFVCINITKLITFQW